MAETSAMNSINKVEQNTTDGVTTIKKEDDVSIKREPAECVLCVSRGHEYFDVSRTNTASSGASLESFLYKHTQVDLSNSGSTAKFICKECFELINVLEQAEIEYNKLKETFDAILKKNPLFSSVSEPVKLSSVKVESPEIVATENNVDDSDEEPLVKKKRRQHKVELRKKKSTNSVTKRKLRSKENEDRYIM